MSDGLPEVLVSAELANASAAWRLAQAAELAGRDIDRLQYADEALYALRRASSCIEEFLTFGHCYMAGSYVPEDQGPF